jgi:hypothetical protein
MAGLDYLTLVSHKFSTLPALVLGSGADAPAAAVYGPESNKCPHQLRRKHFVYLSMGGRQRKCLISKSVAHLMMFSVSRLPGDVCVLCDASLTSCDLLKIQGRLGGGNVGRIKTSIDGPASMCDTFPWGHGHAGLNPSLLSAESCSQGP